MRTPRFLHIALFVLVVLCGACSLLFFFHDTALGEGASPPINIDIDKEIIFQGEPFVLYTNLTEKGNISVEIDNPGEDIVYLKTVQTDASGHASIELKTGSDWSLGRYTAWASVFTPEGVKTVSEEFTVEKPLPVLYPDFSLAETNIWIGSDLNATFDREGSFINLSVDEGARTPKGNLFVFVKIFNLGDTQGNGSLKVFINNRNESNFLGVNLISIKSQHYEIITFPLETRFINDEENNIRVLVSIEDISPKDKNGLDNSRERGFTIAYIPEEEDSQPIIPPSSQPMLALSFSAVALSAYLYTEQGRYKLFSLFMVCYTKLTRKDIENDIMQQNFRGRIYQYVLDHPGAHFNKIKEYVGVGNGTLCYHLDVLQKFGYIRCKNMGGKKVYWMTEQAFPDNKKYPKHPFLTEKQRKIVVALLSGASFSAKELHDLTGLRPSTIDNNLKTLKVLGIVIKEGFYKSSRYSLDDDCEEYYKEYVTKIENDKTELQ